MTEKEPIVMPMLFRKEMRAALIAGAKLYTRRILYPANTVVTPGTFADVRWETGRVNRDDPASGFLRAQCAFEGAAPRVVSVKPKIAAGDVLWVRETRYMSRARSQLTLEVPSVGISRVTDMTDQQAIEEGVEFIPAKMRKHGTPRDWFARLWDDINGPGAWARNDWVWIVGLVAHQANVDRWLQLRE